MKIAVRPERVTIPKSPYSEGFLLYTFEHRGQRQAVWLNKIDKDAEFIRGPGHVWRCSCGANEVAPGAPLTTAMLWAAWSHFDTHIDPPATPMYGAMARWNRGVVDPDMDKVFELELARLLGNEPDIPVEVINVCGECGDTFKISKDDPHWSTGRGPLCPYPEGRS